MVGTKKEEDICVSQEENKKKLENKLKKKSADLSPYPI